MGTTASISIIIQGRRANCGANSGCNGTNYVTLASWTVSPQPVGLTLLAKTPNVAAVCFGTAVSATFTAGSGGVGCSDDYVLIIDNGTPVAYTPGSNVGTTASISIIIQGRRANCGAGSGCNGTTYVTLASWTVNPLPTASIAGTTNVCQNAPLLNVTFTGASGTAPYTFTYKIGMGSNQTVTTTSGNSVTVSAPAGIVGDFAYALVSVKDNSSTQCSQTQSGMVTITIKPLPVVSIPQNDLCTGKTLTLSPTTSGTWTSSNPGIATVDDAGLVKGVSAGVVSFTFTNTATGCQATTGNVTIKTTPSSNLTASKYDVCPNTEVSLFANCSIPTATIQ